jgi:hypothetical protein
VRGKDQFHKSGALGSTREPQRTRNLHELEVDLQKVFSDKLAMAKSLLADVGSSDQTPVQSRPSISVPHGRSR